MHEPNQTQMSNVEKNIGFIYNSRLLDAGLTLFCIVMAAIGFYLHDDLIIAYAIPAAIGLFRQFVALLTFPYVVSVGIATLLTGFALPVFEG